MIVTKRMFFISLEMITDFVSNRPSLASGRLPHTWRCNWRRSVAFNRRLARRTPWRIQAARQGLSQPRA